MLGIDVLDEPGPAQSDAVLLDLQLRAASRRAGAEPALVRRIEHASVAREVGRWISSVAEAHRGSAAAPPPPASTPPLPDVSRLLEREWPPALQALLETTPLPSAELDVSLPEYARIICALLDIPVRGGSLVHALHALFALLIECGEHPGLAAVTLPPMPGSGGAETGAKMV